MTDTRPPAFQLVIEIPVHRSPDISSWPQGLSRMFLRHAVTSEGHLREGRYRFFATCVRRLLLHQSNEVYAYPIHVQLSDRALRGVFRALEPGGAVEPIAPPFDWLLTCSSDAAIITVLREPGFERVVFWSDSDANHARQLVAAATRISDLPDNRDDTPFLEYCSSVGAFVFYSFSHDNLEVVGTTSVIVEKCLPFLMAFGSPVGKSPA
jgi:hypothetical protein